MLLTLSDHMDTFFLLLFVSFDPDFLVFVGEHRLITEHLLKVDTSVLFIEL